jgi:uncharacterized protein (TIGR00266 family)
MTVTRPTWRVNNAGSFASVEVILPPHSEIDCETDAVVSFTQGIQVRGVMPGGILGGLARVFLTRESFFTTKVQNTSSSSRADVLLAPADPGGLVLHALQGQNDDLLLTSGSYVASDSNVQISSDMQTGISNSLLSGTGFFLLRASGRGIVAVAAYGSVHEYRLQEGEERAVDNGHLVAWSANLTYRTALASGRSGGRGIVDSMTSGEGLMCFFRGPGTIYLQSHKPEKEADTVVKGTKRKARQGAAGTGALFGIPFCIIFIVPFLMITAMIAWLSMVAANGSIKFENYGYSTNSHGWNQQYRSDYGDEYSERRYKPQQKVDGRVHMKMREEF